VLAWFRWLAALNSGPRRRGVGRCWRGRHWVSAWFASRTTWKWSATMIAFGNACCTARRSAQPAVLGSAASANAVCTIDQLIAEPSRVAATAPQQLLTRGNIAQPGSPALPHQCRDPERAENSIQWCHSPAGLGRPTATTPRA